MKHPPCPVTRLYTTSDVFVFLFITLYLFFTICCPVQTHSFICCADRLASVGAMVWIGLNHLKDGRGWQWSDGAPLTLVNFTTGTDYLFTPWALSMLDNSSFANTEHNDCIFDIAFLTEEEIRSQSPHHTIFSMYVLAFVLLSVFCPE